VGFNGVFVDFRQFQEYLDRLVGLLVEEIVQALKVLVAEQLPLLVGRTFFQCPCKPPAEIDRNGQKQNQTQFDHQGVFRAFDEA
jgi:hypothetical protein